MIYLALFVAILLPYGAMELIRFRRARSVARSPAGEHMDDAPAEANHRAALTWTAWDEHRLTRLLTDAAHRSTTEKDTP